MKPRINILLFILLNLVSTQAFGIKPSKEYIKIPSDFGVKCVENNFVTTDNFNIESWHILPQGETERNVSIIISYGDYGNMSYWLNHAIALSSAGYDVWLYDYRGFGQSSDFNIDPDMLYCDEFSNDLDAVVKGVSAQTDNKICLFGFSMGSIVSMLYLNEGNDNVDFYIGDGHICFPEQILDRYKKGLKLPIPQTSFQDLYEKNHTPFLVFQGTEDPVCTNSDIDSLKISKKELQVIPYEGKHLHSFLILGDNYISDINTFFNKSE